MRTYWLHQTGVTIHCDVIKAHPPRRAIIGHLPLLLDPLPKRSQEVLSQQPEVSIEVQVFAGVGRRGKVGSKEWPVFLVYLLRGGVDRQVPEVLLLSYT